MECWLERVEETLGLWRVAAETNGYLLVREGAGLLIDCPSVHAGTALAAAGLPAPEIVLHTQVQEEHAREWADFPDARVFVAESARPVAERSPAFFQAAETVWPPDRAWDTLGEEPYGIAGCLTERPPARALAVAGVLRDGEPFAWRGVTLVARALPGSGKRAIGLEWPAAAALFSGDLLHAGGKVVNFYDYERSYGGDQGWREARESLKRVKEMGVTRLFPSTGPIITDPAGDADRLLKRLAGPYARVRRAGERRAPVNYTPAREFGFFREAAPGLYQNQAPGNMIVYVDGQGRGLAVDPGNCRWPPTWAESERLMHADLDDLERATGLKRIERVLLTHAHGDHVQYMPLLRARYGAEVLATPDVAAWLAQPKRYPYPCLLDWYGFPFSTLAADRVVEYGERADWHGTAFEAVWTPGHCSAHAGWLADWRGLRTFCAGDVIQYGTGPIGAGLPFCYNDNGLPDRGPAVTGARLTVLKPDLVLGGHGTSFYDRDGRIARDWAAAAAEAAAGFAEWVGPGDLARATTPPGYDAARAAAVRA